MNALALVPPLAIGSTPVKVMFGVVPPEDAMLPDPVTVVTQVVQVSVSPADPSAVDPPPPKGPEVLMVTDEFCSWALPMVEDAMT